MAANTRPHTGSRGIPRPVWFQWPPASPPSNPEKNRKRRPDRSAWRHPPIMHSAIRRAAWPSHRGGVRAARSQSSGISSEPGTRTTFEIRGLDPISPEIGIVSTDFPDFQQKRCQQKEFDGAGRQEQRDFFRGTESLLMPLEIFQKFLVGQISFSPLSILSSRALAISMFCRLPDRAMNSFQRSTARPTWFIS